jgi:2-keto-4-pentenoate hydratase/2-oxohepta-3-ene-1,7-dioic acid hydratase in catechol pathway
VNTARGDLIDETALAAALTKGTIAGAALGRVSDRTPARRQPAANQAPNLLLGPACGVVFRCGGGTATKLVADEITRALTGRAYANPSPAGNPRLGPCVGGTGKFICIGLNYSDHAAESGAAGSARADHLHEGDLAICGPNDDVLIPRGSEKTDWEVELGVVIGKPAKYVSEADALDHVAGYCVINDVSERAFQIERQASGPRASPATPSARPAPGW